MRKCQLASEKKGKKRKEKKMKQKYTQDKNPLSHDEDLAPKYPTELFGMRYLILPLHVNMRQKQCHNICICVGEQNCIENTARLFASTT